MKKIFIFVLLLLLATGCMRIDNNTDYKQIVESIMINNNNRVNTATRGYKYYLPKGVTVKKDLDFNQTFKTECGEMFLYVDIVSYHYKNTNNNSDNKQDYDFYYETINTKKKGGYVAVRKEDNNEYFVKIVIDYAKIEAYTTMSKVSSIVSYATLILDSIEYNEKLIDKYIIDNNITSNDILYNIKKPDDSKSKFNQYLQEYVDEEVEKSDLPDE